jgi:hemoglobin-like flavoprotein
MALPDLASMKGRNTMTPKQTEIVRTSFASLAPLAVATGATFYDRLFKLDPTLGPLFRQNLAEQSKKLMQMVGLAVSLLDRPDVLVPSIEAMGRRHAIHGVNPHHYTTVGEALIWTLEQGLGEHFTPEVKEAWIAVYELISSTMQRSADALGRDWPFIVIEGEDKRTLA